MARSAQEITVDAAIDAVYAQWTQFEEFPRFMDNVQEVRQIDDRHLHWRANIVGREVEWDSEIREQIPNDKIVWHSDGGATAGLVSFRPMGADQTEVHLELSYEPQGVLEHIGDAVGLVGSQVKGDLERFKDFIEERGRATGSWHGTLANPDAPGGHTDGVGSKKDDMQPRIAPRWGSTITSTAERVRPRTPQAMSRTSPMGSRHGREERGHRVAFDFDAPLGEYADRKATVVNELRDGRRKRDIIEIDTVARTEELHAKHRAILGVIDDSRVVERGLACRGALPKADVQRIGIRVVGHRRDVAHR